MISIHRFSKNAAFAAMFLLTASAYGAPLSVTTVDIDATQQQIIIHGHNFGMSVPLVSLADESLSIAYNSPETITATLPPAFLSNPGSHQLVVTTTVKPASTIMFSVTIGAVGPAGAKGDTGAQGPAGTAGAQGPKGDTGAQGLKGNTGAQGPAGTAGAQGPKGDTGLTGATGPQGPKGDTGLTGPKGDTGLAGSSGPKGDTGLTGATGPKGDTGPQGPQGKPSIISAIYTAQQSADVNSYGGDWVTVPGTYASFNLPQRSVLDLEANGSLNGLGGSYSGTITHCGLRFVVDSSAYGDGGFGDVIVGCGVQNSQLYAGWFCPWYMSRTVQLEAGTHSVYIQQSGLPSTSNGCRSESNPRSAARLKVTVR